MSNQKLWVSILFILFAGGAFAAVQGYTTLRADLIEVGWRIGSVEESLGGLEPETMTEASDAFMATASDIRARLDEVTATAEAAASTAAAAGSQAQAANAMTDGAADQLAALNSQVAEIQSGLSDILSRMSVLESAVITLSPITNGGATAPAAAVDATADDGASDATDANADTPEVAFVEVIVEPAPDAEPATVVEAALGADANEMVMLTSDTTWVRVVSETQGNIFEGLLAPDNTIRVPSSAQPVVARLGNGGQVFVALNGELRGPFGNLGAVVELDGIDSDYVTNSLPLAQEDDQAQIQAVRVADGAQPAPTMRPVPRPAN